MAATNNINDYYRNLENALKNIRLLIMQVEGKITDEYDLTTNYSDILNQLYGTERAINNMLTIHKFQGFAKDEFIAVNSSSNTNIVILEHTVKAWETASSIAKLYNVDLADLLQMNNITSDEIIQGLILKVNVSKNTLQQNATTKNVPVYGSRIGQKIYGYDWPNELQATADGGDIKVLEPLDTLVQGIKNRLTTRTGDYPLEDDFGVDLVGSEVPQNLREGLLIIEATEQLLQDQRVDNIQSMTASSKNNSVSFEATINAVKGKEPITVSA